MYARYELLVDCFKTGFSDALSNNNNTKKNRQIFKSNNNVNTMKGEKTVPFQWIMI